jgi:hypothetical protein
MAPWKPAISNWQSAVSPAGASPTLAEALTGQIPMLIANCQMLASVMFFRYVIAVPGWDLDHYLTRLRDLHLAAET